MRVAQEATSRGVATITSQLQSLDIPALGDEVGRLSRRADANEMAIAATRTQVEALTPPTGSIGRADSDAGARSSTSRNDAGPCAVAAKLRRDVAGATRRCRPLRR